MKTLNHVHRLRRYKYPNGTTVFFCTLNCNFKVETQLAIGKIVLCNICGHEFEMNVRTIKMTLPHCRECGRVRVKGPDGKISYTYKTRAVEAVAADMASSTVSSLRDRLNQTSHVVQMEAHDEEDI